MLSPTENFSFGFSLTVLPSLCPGDFSLDSHSLAPEDELGFDFLEDFDFNWAPQLPVDSLSLFSVLSFLSSADLAKAASVNKAFRRVSEYHFKKLLERFGQINMALVGRPDSSAAFFFGALLMVNTTLSVFRYL